MTLTATFKLQVLGWFVQMQLNASA